MPHISRCAQPPNLARDDLHILHSEDCKFVSQKQQYCKFCMLGISQQNIELRAILKRSDTIKGYYNELKLSRGNLTRRGPSS
jgi:hypothetical protein